MPLPVLFISHGSPMLAIDDSPARHFLLGLGKTLPHPKAIVVVSAHWESMGGVAVSHTLHPETIHDFGGFSKELYQIQYPAPGAPDVAARTKELLIQAGFNVMSSATRGLDHGAWVPLHLIYPDASIPVLQVSLRRGGSPAEHMQMGKALRQLSDDEVLIIGSGSITHNLYEFRAGSIDAEVPSWVSEFNEWIFTQLQHQQYELLLDYRVQAPFAERNHPSEEHLLPLFFVMGAASEMAQVERLHTSYEYGVLAMDMYAFS